MTAEMVATAGELQTVLGPLGANAEFCNAQVRAGATIDVAVVRWAGCMAAELKDAKAELETLRAENKQAKLKLSKGYTPVADFPPGGSGARTGATAQALAEGSATDMWNASVKDLMESKRIPKNLAVRQLVKSNPELHAAYLEDVNAVRA